MIFLKGKSVLNVNVAWEPDTELMHAAFCSTCDPLSQHSIIHKVQQVCKTSADLAIPPKEHCVMELSDPVQTIFSSSYLVFVLSFFLQPLTFMWIEKAGVLVQASWTNTIILKPE